MKVWQLVLNAVSKRRQLSVASNCYRPTLRPWILTLNDLSQSTTVTDRQTDRQTDSNINNACVQFLAVQIKRIELLLMLAKNSVRYVWRWLAKLVSDSFLRSIVANSSSDYSFTLPLYRLQTHLFHKLLPPLTSCLHRLGYAARISYVNRFLLWVIFRWCSWLVPLDDATSPSAC